MRFEKPTIITVLALALLSAPPGILAADKSKPAAKPPAAPTAETVQSAPPVASNAARAEQESEQAAQAYQARDFQEAAKRFQRVVQLDPANAKAWLFLGQSLAQSNDNMGARKAFAKVLALQPAGPVAERAREQFGKLPEPDLFAMQLDIGLTLGDWLPLAEKQAAQGKREDVLREIGKHLNQFGPVPQLLALQDQLQQQVQAEQEKHLAALKINDAESAKAALPQIRQLKQQTPGSLAVLRMEAKACHLMQDFACAEAAYAAWLKAAPGSDSKRKRMVAALMQAKQREALSAELEVAEREEDEREEDEQWQKAQETASHAAMQAYMTHYPNGRFFAEALKKDEEYQRPPPPRPSLPFAIDESIWRTLEASEMYRNSPRPRTIKISYLDSDGFLTSSLMTPLGDKCSLRRENSSLKGESAGDSVTYRCASFLTLGENFSGHGLYIKSLDDLKGSLFPMRIGAQLSIRSQLVSERDRSLVQKNALFCEVVNKESARELNPRLTGTAWKIHCQIGRNSNTFEIDHYYLEDLGVMLSEIGLFDEPNKYVLPSSGSQTTYGGNKTTYRSYDWTVGE